jgi:signal transduction histidine kinase
VQAAFERVEAIVETERRVLLGILVATVVLGSLLAWIMARSLSRPISDLRGAMAIVGAGNLNHPVKVDSEDEIGDLARAFAGMTDRLRETQSQLVQSEKLASLGEMAAGVAHGLRNPLSSLRASAQLVLKHPNSPAAGEQLQAIIDEVDRLDRRISHLLTFSKPAPFRPGLERIEPLVQAALPTFADRIRSQGVTLVVAIDPALPEVAIDPMKVEQALLELIGNALDAMPAGGRLEIAAKASNHVDRPPGITVTIKDTGRGISPDTLREVGQPFFTTRPEGTGLGLATARRFIEQHGGKVELQSEVGVGTTVSIWLPLGTAGVSA